MKGNPPSQHNILKQRLNLNFKKTHSSLLKKVSPNTWNSRVVSQIVNRTAPKPLAWKRYISVWNIYKDEIAQFIKQVNSHCSRLNYPTPKQGSPTQLLTKDERFTKVWTVH